MRRTFTREGEQAPPPEMARLCPVAPSSGGGRKGREVRRGQGRWDLGFPCHHAGMRGERGVLHKGRVLSSNNEVMSLGE
jgi:hypothetical protein